MKKFIKSKLKFFFYILKYYFKLFLKIQYFSNKEKVKNIDAVFVYNLDYRNQEGASGYLHYWLKMISKYSRFNFKNLNSLNYKSHRNYKIKKLILFFPQSLGFDISTELVESSKKIIFFANDNNIFCKQSYNVYKGKECFRCLKKYNPHKDCNHFPFDSLDKSYLNLLSILKKKSKDILFVCHSLGHKKIIQSIYPLSKILKSKHYSFKFKNIKTQKIKFYDYDFLFHASPLEAKGYYYFLKLANINQSQSFFVPNFESYSAKFKNVEFNKVSWDDGLMKKIYNSKIILCPSLWTANFEGTVIKTMLMGKCCAIINNSNSFSKEIPSNSVIKLTGKLKKDSNLLKKMLKNQTEIERIGKNARIWALKYIKHNPKKETKFLDDFLIG